MPYKFNPFTGTFDEVNDSGTSGSVKVENRIISAGEATAKQLTLLQTPSPANETVVSVVEGSTQYYGTDFNVSGTTLSWSGLGLDGLLATNDKIVIIYKY